MAAVGVVRGAERPWQDRGHPWAPLQKTVGHESGAAQLSVWRNEVAPGQEVRRHWHDVEEAILVVAGRMSATIGDERYELGSGDALLIPARVVHGFRNAGSEHLSIVASLASAAPETNWEDEGDASGLHLDDARRAPRTRDAV